MTQVWSTVSKLDRWPESRGAKYANMLLVNYDLDILGGTELNSARLYVTKANWEERSLMLWEL
jgi:hypothetical protein